MNLGLHCLGVSHHTAPVALRERLAIDTRQRDFFRSGLLAQIESAETVFLSTCNRTELYIAVPAVALPDLTELVAKTFQLPRTMLEPILYSFGEESAIRHLFRVAAGLDSMVLGEAQVLGQVTAAYTDALAAQTVGPVLSRLFQAAIRAGKRVRTHTDIGRHAVSIASLAAQKAQEQITQLAAASVTLLGAGEMAELAMEAFRKRGVQDFTVVNRTLATASTLAARWQGTALTMEKLGEAIARADILLTSSAAPHALVDRLLVETAMAARSARPLVILDVAVPRDVAPEVGALPHVTLYDMDDLQSASRLNQAARANEIPRAEEILQEECHACVLDLQALQAASVIRELRQHVESIRVSELEKTLRRLDDLSPEQIQRIEALTQSIVQKLLHAPTVRLRQEAGQHANGELETVVRELFALSPPAPNELENRP